MNYAILENGVVINVIVGPLPDGMNGVPTFDRPVAIGDTFDDGVFRRYGEAVLTDAERIAALEQQILTLQKQLQS